MQVSSFSGRRVSVIALLVSFKHGTEGVQIRGGWLNGWQNPLENGMMHQPNSSSSLSGSACEATYGRNVIFLNCFGDLGCCCSAVLQACRTDTQTTVHVGYCGLLVLLPLTMNNENMKRSNFSDRSFSVIALLVFFKHGTKGVQIRGGWLNGWQNPLENGMMHQPNSSSSLSGSACEATYGRNVIFLNCFGDLGCCCSAVLQACRTDTQTTVHVGYCGLLVLLPLTMNNENMKISNFSGRRSSVIALLVFFNHRIKGVEIRGGWLNGWHNPAFVRKCIHPH